MKNGARTTAVIKIIFLVIILKNLNAAVTLHAGLTTPKDQTLVMPGGRSMRM